MKKNPLTVQSYVMTDGEEKKWNELTRKEQEELSKKLWKRIKKSLSEKWDVIEREEEIDQ